MPTISDDEALLVIQALQHFDAYFCSARTIRSSVRLKASKREDKAYKDLADMLERKPVAQETNQTATKRKKA